MAYSQQSFSTGQILTAAQMNQTEVNVRDHVHGKDGVSRPASAIVYGASGTQITSGDTSVDHTIQFMTSAFLLNGFSVGSGHTLTVNSTGFFFINASFLISDPSSNNSPRISIYKNTQGAPILKNFSLKQQNANAFASYGISGGFILSANDYLFFELTRVGSGTSIQFTNEGSHATIFQIP